MGEKSKDENDEGRNKSVKEEINKIKRGKAWEVFYFRLGRVKCLKSDGFRMTNAFHSSLLILSSLSASAS